MVIPSALPRTNGSVVQSSSTSVVGDSIKVVPPSVHGAEEGQTSVLESRDVVDTSTVNKKLNKSKKTTSTDREKDETWFKYFFGQTGEANRDETEQQQPGQAESQAVDSRDAASSTNTTREETVESKQQNSSEQRIQQSKEEDAEAYPSWLSWLDPASTSGGCVASNEPPAIAKKDQKAKDATKENEETQKSSQKQQHEGAPQRQLIDPPEEMFDGTASVDSSVEESKLFRDLDSVGGSTKVGTIAGSIKTTDLDLHDGASTTMGSVSETVVGNKLERFKLPRHKRRGSKAASADASAKLQSEKADAKKSLEARREILVNELRSTISNHGRYDVKTANISAALGDLLDESKQYDQAIKLHRDAVEIYSSKLGDDNATTMEAKLQLGKVLENANKLDEAINIYFLVTMMRRAVNGEDDPSSADSLVLMAHALRKKDDYHQAIKELKRALKIYREALGDSHVKVSTTVDEIASLYVTIGDFEKSAAILEEVVKLKAVTQGMQSKAVATTLCSLATTYECSEDFTKAMKSLKKAYKIYTEMDGYSSKEATNTLNRIAQLYEATGDHDRASIAYLGVLRGRKINFGDDHLQVAETYYKLGHALRESGQYEKALKCLKEGLPIFVNKGVEINDVEMIAEVMHEMALINKERKKFNEAARIFKQELGVRRKIGQADYPMIARTLNHLGVTEYEMKNNNKSLKYLVEALTIFKSRAEGSVECAEVLFNTGLVFESSRNKERAMEAYEEAARIFKDHGYKETHPHLAKATRKIEKLGSQQRGGGGLKM